ncbi:MAG TPA: anthranilate phosphoribosyltransferase [Candidatus Saccharimonadales bacterium]|nr:anthranilate phosphoribosyltransferase [Candidatus Saccharimonadales bacterium]
MKSKEILEKLFNKENLQSEEISSVLNDFIKGELNDSQMAAFLIALRMKGETVDEIASLIQTMRGHMIPFPEVSDAFDTCGTGGDGAGTFNISTTVAFVMAGAGVPIIKHGNKAASSRCGSADVLTELGIKIMLDPEQAKKIFDAVGMIFLFAPLYHPATKRIVPVRQALGTRTVFNYLGPFLNPAKVTKQIIGVPNQSIAKILGEVAVQFNYRHLLIVTSESGMDEIDIIGKTNMFEIKEENISEKIINPQELGFQEYFKEQVSGGDVKENAQILIDILTGKKDARRDIVVLNSAYALLAADKVSNVIDGMRLAEESIDNGNAKKVLEKLKEETQKYA